MKPKLAVMLYVPPARFHPEVIINNLRRFEPRHELILVSDSARPGTAWCSNPEGFQNQLPAVSNRANNLAFWFCFKVALERGVTHFLYLESDCRVATMDFDDVIFKEYFRTGRPWAGTLMAADPYNAGSAVARRYVEFTKMSPPEFPVISVFNHAACPPGRATDASFAFANGALSVFDVAFFADLMSGIDILDAADTQAWDLNLGQRIWKRYGAKAWDCVAPLTCVLSQYGDSMSTENERMEWLRQGKIVAAHQVKSLATVEIAAAFVGVSPKATTPTLSLKIAQRVGSKEKAIPTSPKRYFKFSNRAPVFSRKGTIQSTPVNNQWSVWSGTEELAEALLATRLTWIFEITQAEHDALVAAGSIKPARLIALAKEPRLESLRGKL